MIVNTISYQYLLTYSSAIFHIPDKRIDLASQISSSTHIVSSELPKIKWNIPLLLHITFRVIEFD